VTRANDQVQVLVFDLNAICYAAAFLPAFANLEHDGQRTGVILGGLNSILSALTSHPNAIPVGLWDGKAQWRHELHPGYKAGRDDSPDKRAAKAMVREQGPLLAALLMDAGFAQIRHPDAEADDLAGFIVASLSAKGVATRMVTGDTDWWQAIGAHADWYSTRDHRVVDLQGLRELAGASHSPKDGWRSPREYLDAKIIAGDSSDEIDGVAGFGLITAAKFLRATTHGEGLKDILNGDFEGKGVLADRLRSPEAGALIVRNSALMDWSLSAAPSVEHLAAVAYEPDLVAAQEHARRYGLRDVVKRMPAAFDRPRTCDHPLWRDVVHALEWEPHQRRSGESDENELQRAAAPQLKAQEPCL
jgi:5'-3' exonuclease